jgi:hypothetical protein
MTTTQAELRHIFLFRTIFELTDRDFWILTCQGDIAAEVEIQSREEQRSQTNGLSLDLRGNVVVRIVVPG